MSVTPPGGLRSGGEGGGGGGGEALCPPEVASWLFRASYLLGVLPVKTARGARAAPLPLPPKEDRRLWLGGWAGNTTGPDLLRSHGKFPFDLTADTSKIGPCESQ